MQILNVSILFFFALIIVHDISHLLKTHLSLSTIIHTFSVLFGIYRSSTIRFHLSRSPFRNLSSDSPPRVVVWHERTDVEFAPLSDAAIRAYIATGEPMDKAGGYGLQVLVHAE